MRFRGATDEITKIDLPSSIERVAWTKRTASPDSHVGLEILTRHVGSNAEISIELSDHEGNKFGNFKEKISGNRFWAQIKVPQDAKQALYATAKLPKHGLQMKSDPLTFLPAVEITNPKWDKKEARRGDILKLTADVKGVEDGAEAEIQIWEHDSDGAHDLITKFPVLVKNKMVEAEWEYEYHEDTDDIPDDEENEKGYNPPEYFFRISLGGVQADSGLLEFKDWLEISLKDGFGDPVHDADYVVKLADGSEQKGKLDKDGRARIEDIPPGSYWIHFPEHEDDL
jgi:hypothetical protein